MKTNEEHLKELESEKETEQDEGVLCTAPLECIVIVPKVHSQVHPKGLTAMQLFCWLMHA